MKTASLRSAAGFSTVDEVRHFVEKVLPDPARRHRALSLFADSVDHVHAFGASKWGVYCDDRGQDRIRLLCGMFIVFTINSRGIWLSLDKETLDSSRPLHRALLAAGGWRPDKGQSPDGYPIYALVPSTNIYYVPDGGHDRNWPPIGKLHFAHLDRVARKYRDLRTSSQATHQPPLLAYLRGFLRRDLPDPVYPSDQSGGGAGSTSRERRGLPSLLEPTADECERLGDFDAANAEDARRRVLASIVRRQGQPAFRRRLLEAYGGACAFSGCSVQEILDAAHIVPYKGRATNHPQNGMLLRADLHTLFDLHLLAVDTADMTIVVAPSLKGTEYAALSGTKVRVPIDQAFEPSALALDGHRRKFLRHSRP